MATVASTMPTAWCALSITAGDKLDLAALRRSNNTSEPFCRNPSSPSAFVNLERNVPSADVIKNHDGPLSKWFQLGGHENSLRPSGHGSVRKYVSGNDNFEMDVYEALNKDSILRGLVPRFFKSSPSENYIEIEDLLFKFNNPHVMVLKMGTRTYLESDKIDVEREDLYQKMVKLDPNSPTEAERKIGKVTKKRYMEFREKKSSSAKMGFRVEGIKHPNRKPQTDFQNLVDPEEVMATVASFLSGRPSVRKSFLERLNYIRERLEQSDYFKHHEMVGTSLYLIYDEEKFGAWLIDFGKTRRVPDGIELDHRTPWEPGTHEEGFLFGLDTVIKILEEVNVSSEKNEKER